MSKKIAQEITQLVLEFQGVRHSLIKELLAKYGYLNYKEEDLLIDQFDNKLFKHTKLLSKDLLKQYRIKKEIIIKRMYYVVMKISRHYSSKYKQVDFQDLVQEGLIAVVRSTVKYNYSRNDNFPLYAELWIRDAERKFIHKNFSVLTTRQYDIQQLTQKYKEHDNEECSKLLDMRDNLYNILAYKKISVENIRSLIPEFADKSDIEFFELVLYDHERAKFDKFYNKKKEKLMSVVKEIVIYIEKSGIY